jgi:hypothetical protein
MIYLIALIFPWLAFMMKGSFGLGLLCLLLQMTLIGWIPATIWAIVHINNKNAEERNNKVLKAIKENQVYQK